MKYHTMGEAMKALKPSDEKCRVSRFMQYATVIQDSVLGSGHEAYMERADELRKRGFSETPMAGLAYHNFTDESATGQMLTLCNNNVIWAVDPEGKGLWVLEHEYRDGEPLYKGGPLGTKASFIPKETLNEWHGLEPDYHHPPVGHYYSDPPSALRNKVRPVTVSEFLAAVAKPGRAEELGKALGRNTYPWLFEDDAISYPRPSYEELLGDSAASRDEEKVA